MAEKEYIESEAAKKAMCRMCEGGAKLVCGTLNDCCTTMRIFDSIPAADVRPVVFCKDCRHRDPEDHKCDCGQLERAGCVFPVDNEYFCAYGEES